MMPALMKLAAEIRNENNLPAIDAPVLREETTFLHQLSNMTEEELEEAAKLIRV